MVTKPTDNNAPVVSPYEVVPGATDGNDRLQGNDGSNLLDGGLGNDILIGGGGKDLFVFKPGYGQDTVLDFQAKNDSGAVDVIGQYGCIAPTFYLGRTQQEAGD